MIASKFEYKRAHSVSEVLQALSENSEAKILAGGHSLLPAMKLRLSSPETLIDISRVEALNGIRNENGNIVIGANTTHAQIEHSSMIADKVPMLSEAAGMIGDPMVRNAGTIGGSIAHADPAADWPGLLIAAEATIALQSQQGTRQVKASDFFKGLFMTELTDKELITAIHIPLPKGNHRSTYQKFTQPASRFAICGCAVSLTMDGNMVSDIRVAFSGVSSKPFRDTGVENVLRGKALNDENIEAASKLAAANVSIMSDHFASQKYRRHLATVYTKRALNALK